VRVSGRVRVRGRGRVRVGVRVRVRDRVWVRVSYRRPRSDGLPSRDASRGRHAG
jgi:hypothetical protein